MSRPIPNPPDGGAFDFPALLQQPIPVLKFNSILLISCTPPSKVGAWRSPETPSTCLETSQATLPKFPTSSPALSTFQTAANHEPHQSATLPQCASPRTRYRRRPWMWFWICVHALGSGFSGVGSEFKILTGRPWELRTLRIWDLQLCSYTRQVLYHTYCLAWWQTAF